MEVIMKHNIIIFILLLTFMTLYSASAQQLYFGVLGGVNFADLNGKDKQGEELNVSTRSIPGIGGVIGLNLDQNFSFQLELMYLQKGGVLRREPSDAQGIKSKMSFIEVPLFLKIQFGEQIRPYIMGGPMVGFLLSSKFESEIGGLLFKGDVQHITRKVDFSVGLGAGVNIPVGSSNIFLDGRYTLGLTNLNKGGNFEASAGDILTEGEVDRSIEISTKGFQIMLGVAFPIGG
jgi:hypothetical protein